jgi:hypothetical protein
VTRLGRLAGALLFEARGRYFLIGNRKRPCDFAAAGFAAPAEAAIVELTATGPLAVATVWLELPDGDPDTLAAELSRRLTIPRTGAVSDRLWRLILAYHNDPEAEPPTTGSVPARWLLETPAHVWQIVRDNVLTCS